ncbi:MAG: hypothetical protein M1160_03245 [Candidatus Marsarchaeota archaeon]|jgi:hypothetical protein|nr:hypothetical protein [Candidatus Marsarchaeota archaeon]MCL5111864.1 hypothetical protein [Candidatus Marsarchaeota archaeon]
MERKEILDEIAKMQMEKVGYSVKRSQIAYQHMRDPALLRQYYRMKMQPMTDSLEIYGSSPTDIFIGRHNYPNVYIGPMVPPEFGDTSLMGMPEGWVHFSMETIVDFRSRLVRGMHLSRVTDVNRGKMQQQITDLALAGRPADSEVHFSRKPFVKMTLMDEVQPFGPSALMKSMEVSNVSADRKVERLYLDTDAKANTAIKELYHKGIQVSKIQKSLSAGLFGIGRNRRFVPTRWSITAVDDTLGKDNLAEVKSYSPMDVVYAYYHVSLDNRWLIFFMPGNWEYESAEAWWPKTVWNADGTSISIYSSYEGYNGRKDYAEIGGCYYAARLAVSERLKELKRQAVVLILREVHEGYLMPVGVWNVREHVREALGKKPDVLHSTDDVFSYIKGKMGIPLADWIRNCRILRDMLMQRKLQSYMK